MNVCCLNKYIDKIQELELKVDYCQFNPRDESIAIQKGDEELYIKLDMPEEMQNDAFKLFLDRIGYGN